MKIAVIGVKGIPAKQGQIKRYCQELYPKITLRGHQVSLFAQPQYHDQPWFSIYYYKSIKVIALFSLPGKKLLEYALSEPEILQTMAKQVQMYTTVNHGWDRIIYGYLSVYLKATTKLRTQSNNVRI
ncbi:MAG: hypothetical protein ACRC06_18735 [Waterburya sp.]